MSPVALMATIRDVLVDYSMFCLVCSLLSQSLTHKYSPMRSCTWAGGWKQIFGSRTVGCVVRRLVRHSSWLLPCTKLLPLPTMFLRILNRYSLAIRILEFS
eukprot:SAG31_NODE_23821_length_494_cov_10.779747_1_plen_100_part_10